MEGDWVKVLASNVSVAGVLLYWIWWLLQERKADKDNLIKREEFWARREDKALSEVKELNERALLQQKENLQFLRDFKDALEKADARTGISVMTVLIKKIAAKQGIDTTDS